MRRRHHLFTATLATIALLAPVPAGSQESSAQTGVLAPPEEWTVGFGHTSPLRTPPVPPLEVAQGRELARAPDGSQVAWIADAEGHGLDEVVVADLWGGGRRTVYRARAVDGGQDDSVTAVAFTRDASAVLLLDSDKLRRVDLATGHAETLLVHDGFSMTTEEGGPIEPNAVEELATGDIVVTTWCYSESCHAPAGSILWRRDTDAVVELPYGLITNDGRAIVTTEFIDDDTSLRIAPVRHPDDHRELARLADDHPLLRNGAIRADDRVIALTGPYSDGVEVRSLDDGTLLASAPSPSGATFAGGRWSPDGRRFATTAVWQEPFALQPWVLDLDAGTADPKAERDASLKTMGWSDDGALLVDDNEHVWRVMGDGSMRPVAHMTSQKPPRRPLVGGVGRYAGEDRVATATALSRAAFEAADTVVVARADLYPDALSGSALAGQVDGPVLLTRSDRLDGRVVAEVDRLGASTAYVLGTTDVMSRQVERDLRATGIERVIRLGGADRFHTAAMVAAEVRPDRGRVFLVEGQDVDPARGWPDAVAVAGEAAATATPVLLATTERVPGATREAIADLGVERVTIVGGPVAISREVEQQLRSWGLTVERVAGDTRYATSVAVASRQDEVSLPFAVTGSNWPDALAAGPAAAHVGGTVLLVPPDSITANRNVESFLHERTGAMNRVAVAGSTGVVSQRIVRELDRILRNG